MTDIVFSDTQATQNLRCLFVGYEKCISGHSFGPYVRHYYLLHFCLSGSGTLENRHGRHAVHKGQLFVIRPDEVTTYTADEHDPWEYAWLAFDGERAHVFDGEPSIFSIPTDIDERLAEHVKAGVCAPEIYLSLLFELVFSLFCEQRTSKSYDKVRTIKRYVHYNYMLPLTVESLAKSFGFERSYLYRIFKQRYGVGIKEYIVHVRMKNARDFLTRGCTVAECAHLVGYEDEFNFSKAFKKHFGIPPSKVLPRSSHASDKD